MYQGIIFDLDGTLADTRKDIAASVNIMRKRLGRSPLPEAEIISYVGNGSRKLVERSLKGESQQFIEQAFSIYNSCYQETLCIHSQLYDGVKEGLAVLKEKGYHLAVLSNKPHELTFPLIHELGIAAMFDCIQGGTPAIPLKPDPAGTILLLDKMNADHENSWVLGDNYTDLGTGRNAGTKRAFAAWGFGSPQNETWDFKADSFSAFVNYLDSKKLL